jgi:hypothetical protein
VGTELGRTSGKRLRGDAWDFSGPVLNPQAVLPGDTSNSTCTPAWQSFYDHRPFFFFLNGCTHFSRFWTLALCWRRAECPSKVAWLLTKGPDPRVPQFPHLWRGHLLWGLSEPVLNSAGPPLPPHEPASSGMNEPVTHRVPRVRPASPDPQNGEPGPRGLSASLPDGSAKARGPSLRRHRGATHPRAHPPTTPEPGPHPEPTARGASATAAAA